MNKEHRIALKELKEKVKQREIRISKADKGGAVVVTTLLFTQKHQEIIRTRNTE